MCCYSHTLLHKSGHLWKGGRKQPPFHCDFAAKTLRKVCRVTCRNRRPGLRLIRVPSLSRALAIHCLENPYVLSKQSHHDVDGWPITFAKWIKGELDSAWSLPLCSQFLQFLNYLLDTSRARVDPSSTGVAIIIFVLLLLFLRLLSASSPPLFCLGRFPPCSVRRLGLWLLKNYWATSWAPVKSIPRIRCPQCGSWQAHGGVRGLVRIPTIGCIVETVPVPPLRSYDPHFLDCEVHRSWETRNERLRYPTHRLMLRYVERSWSNQEPVTLKCDPTARTLSNP